MNQYMGNAYGDTIKEEKAIGTYGACIVNLCFGDVSSSCTGNFCGTNEHSGCFWFACGTRGAN